MERCGDFLKETGYGDDSGQGLHGYNCRHSFYPYFPEYQKPPYTEEQLKEQAEKDKKTTNYKWNDSRGVEHERDFTYRQALDRQRQMERQMRKTRSMAMAFKAARNREGYEESYNLYRRQLSEYKHFSKSMGIDEQLNRVYMDNVGRLLKWKSEWA